MSLVLLLAFAVRQQTFAMPHVRADEPANLALAESLEHGDYSIRFIAMRYFPIAGSNLGAVRFERSDQQQGEVLRYYRSSNLDYDSAVSNRPPLFPALLMCSRRVWGIPRYVVLGVRLVKGEEALSLGGQAEVRRRAVSRSLAGGPDTDPVVALQRYATVLPLLGSLLFVAATYLLAFVALPSAEGIGLVVRPTVAALIASAVPIEILVAHLVQPDTIAAGCGALGACLAVLALREDRRALAWAALAAVALGVGALAKPSVVPFGVAYGATELILAARNKRWRPALTRLGVFTGVVLVTCGWWYARAFVSPDVAVPTSNVLNSSDPSFSSLVIGRTWLTYPANLIVHAPLLALAAFPGLPWLWRRSEPDGNVRPFLLLAVCALTVFALGTLGYSDRESRYLLPLYPLLAVVAAHSLEELRALLQRRLASNVVAALLVYVPVVGVVIRGVTSGRAAPGQGFLVWNAEALFGF